MAKNGGNAGGKGSIGGVVSKLDLGTFAVERVAIHQMPKVKVAERDVVAFKQDLVEAEIDLTDLKLKRFFRERIVGSMKRKSFVAVYDDSQDVESDGDDDDADDDGASTTMPRKADQASVVPTLVVDYFEHGVGDLIPLSQAMAVELYERQGGGNSAGLLVVADARVGAGADTGAVLVVMKLEDDEALLVDKTTNKDGKTTYDASVRPVTMPEKAEVYKAAIFVRCNDLSTLLAHVSDNQRDANDYGREIADFFLKFLGCKLRDTADRSTLNYLERAERFVESVQDEESKADYLDIILTDLKSASTEIDPKKVAKKLKKEDRDAFLDQMKLADGTIPLITKDLTRVGGSVDNVMYEFAGGIKVWGPRAAITEHLQKVEDGGGWMLASTLQKTGPTRRR